MSHVRLCSRNTRVDDCSDHDFQNFNFARSTVARVRKAKEFPPQELSCELGTSLLEDLHVSVHSLIVLTQPAGFFLGAAIFLPCRCRSSLKFKLESQLRVLRTQVESTPRHACERIARQPGGVSRHYGYLRSYSKGRRFSWCSARLVQGNFFLPIRGVYVILSRWTLPDEYIPSVPFLYESRASQNIEDVTRAMKTRDALQNAGLATSPDIGIHIIPKPQLARNMSNALCIRRGFSSLPDEILSDVLEYSAYTHETNGDDEQAAIQTIKAATKLSHTCQRFDNS